MNRKLIFLDIDGTLPPMTSMDAMVWSSFRTKLVCLEQVPLFAKLNSLLMVSNFLSLSYKGKAFSGFIVYHCRRSVCGRSPVGG